MTGADEAQTGAVREVQRLFDERGPWEAAGGAYLESDEVAVLLQPAQAAAEPLPAVDLVVTMHSRLRPSPFAGLELQLEDASGSTRSIRLSTGGRGLFRSVPTGAWRAHLRQAGEPPARAGEPPWESGAEVIPFRRILRRSALAAGSATPAKHPLLTSAGGDLTAEIVETDDGRLEITFEAPPERGGGSRLLARVNWAPVVGGAPGRSRTLVTPLAPGLDAGPRTARYDLASLADVEGIDIWAPAWIEASELTPQAVEDTFGLTLYGMAHRAWQALAEARCCPEDVQDALIRALETKAGT